jgi:sporulation protein YlmC with PRC-barrel domain
MTQYSDDRHAMAHEAGRRGELPIEETERLIASDRVEGTDVYDRQGQRLGTVQNFMVDKMTGKVAYAVLSFGGFLGIGSRYHPLPWKSLTYDVDLGGFVVDVTRDQLESAPSYEAAEIPWSDPRFGRSVYDYYNIPWYM